MPSFLAVIPTAVAAKMILDLNRKNFGPSFKPTRLGIRHFVTTLTIGPMIFLGVIGSTGLVPSTSVQTGLEISSHHENYLRKTKIVADDETISFFYSGGMFSAEADGVVITDRRVITYFTPFDKPERESSSLSLDEIENVDVTQGDELINTYIEVTDTKGGEVYFEISTEEGKDQPVIDLLTSRAEKNR